MDISYRPATRSDVPALMDLMNVQYVRKKTEAYFHWQYFDSFFPSVMMCALDGEKLIGMFGLQKRTLKNRMMTAQAMDLLVDPALRGQGIFKALGEHALRYFTDIDLFWVLPNAHGRLACERALGWRTLGKIDTLQLDYSEVRDHGGDTRHGEIILTDSFDQFDYTASYRQWRFGKNPEYSYDTVDAANSGYAVTKVFTDPVDGKRFGDIVQYEHSSEATGSIFGKTIDTLSQGGIAAITSWALPHTPVYQHLIALGFVARPQERYFCVQPVRSSSEYLYDFTRWHLVEADAEFY